MLRFYILFLSSMVVRNISADLYIILHVIVDVGEFSMKLKFFSPTNAQFIKHIKC
jgi:hypothetical protein